MWSSSDASEGPMRCLPMSIVSGCMAVFRKQVFTGISILMVSIWVRTYDLLVCLSVLAWLCWRRELKPSHAALLGHVGYNLRAVWSYIFLLNADARPCFHLVRIETSHGHASYPAFCSVAFYWPLRENYPQLWGGCSPRGGMTECPGVPPIRRRSRKRVSGLTTSIMQPS
jgi:hypothetical protein